MPLNLLLVVLVFGNLGESESLGLFGYLTGMGAQTKCEIKFIHYRKCSISDFQEFCVQDALQLFQSPSYDKQNKTVLVGVPFHRAVDHPDVQGMVNALISRCEFNVIVLDTSLHTNTLNYLSAVRAAEKDGALYAEALNEAISKGLLSSKQVIGLGFSLGAQTMGSLCRNLQGKCCSLYAIDAAGPLFLPLGKVISFSSLPLKRTVSKADACHVTALYCNMGFMGTLFDIGHDNVVVNSGIFQPGLCNVFNFLCSHTVCNKLLIEAITFPGTCHGRRCSSILGVKTCDDKPTYQLDLFTNQTCDRCDSDVSVSYAIRTSINPGQLCNV